MGKTELRVRKFGDPVLRKKSALVKEITAEHREFLSKMAQLMYEDEGVGLAAPQVGLSLDMIVVDIGKGGLYKLINPKITKFQGSQVNKEGCLSVPGACIKVKRANKVKLEALDETGKPLNLEAEGLLACVFQHEIDHLRGKLIVDYASLLEKIKIAKVLKELKKEVKNAVFPGQRSRTCKEL
jgi:peptide deformylase